jgi:hypothetical protein
MATPKREIYSIAFNKRISHDGTMLADMYTVGILNLKMAKIPESIVVTKGNKVIVTFKDGSRHVFDASGVEIFDRLVELKEVKANLK